MSGSHPCLTAAPLPPAGLCTPPEPVHGAAEMEEAGAEALPRRTPAPAWLPTAKGKGIPRCCEPTVPCGAAHPAPPAPVGSVRRSHPDPLSTTGGWSGTPTLPHRPPWEHPGLTPRPAVPTQVRRGTSACARRTAQPGCAAPVTSGPKSASRCCGKGRCVPGTGGKAPTAWRSSSGASAPRGWRAASSESTAPPMPPACTPASGTERRRTDGRDGLRPRRSGRLFLKGTTF